MVRPAASLLILDLIVDDYESLDTLRRDQELVSLSGQEILDGLREALDAGEVEPGRWVSGAWQAVSLAGRLTELASQGLWFRLTDVGLRRWKAEQHLLDSYYHGGGADEKPQPNQGP